MPLESGDVPRALNETEGGELMKFLAFDAVRRAADMVGGRGRRGRREREDDVGRKTTTRAKERRPPAARRCHLARCSLSLLAGIQSGVV
jgi:hypothetical protein